MWEHSPTRKKKRRRSRLKCGGAVRICVTAPMNSPVPTNPWALHLPTNLARGAHTGAHVDPRCRVALRHVAARCASCASRGPPAALPRGLRAASHPRGGPARHVSARRLPRSPRQHLQVNTPFLRFVNKNLI